MSTTCACNDVVLSLTEQYKFTLNISNFYHLLSLPESTLGREPGSLTSNIKIRLRGSFRPLRQHVHKQLGRRGVVISQHPPLLNCPPATAATATASSSISSNLRGQPLPAAPRQCDLDLQLDHCSSSHRAQFATQGRNPACKALHPSSVAIDSPCSTETIPTVKTPLCAVTNILSGSG